MAYSFTKNQTLTAYFTALIWPFFALIFAVINYRSSFSKNILWIFCAFFGYTFIISNPDMDANRYKLHLERSYAKNHLPYNEVLADPFTNKGIYSGTDVYSHFITTTVGRFTNDFRIFFGVIGLIFGYFYSRNLFYVLKHLENKNLLFLTVLFVFTLALIIPFWNINGYRFYTASHVFLFGVLRILFERKYGYLIIILMSPLIHFSFALPTALFLIYLLIGNKTWMYIMMLGASLFFVDLNPKTINENYELAPVFVQNKVKGYSSKDYVKFVQKNTTGMNWYVKGHLYALLFCLYSFIFYIFLKRKQFLRDHISASVFSFGLLTLAMANSVSSLPSMDRFYLLGAIILCISFIYIFQANTKHRLFKRLGYFYTIPVLIFLVVEIRIGFDFIGLNSILLNPMIAPFFPDSPALIEFFK